MGKYTPELDSNWQDRADNLAETTVLTQRQAEVKALSEQGLTRQGIADELEISINTVDEHRQETKKKVQLAENTLEEFKK